MNTHHGRGLGPARTGPVTLTLLALTKLTATAWATNARTHLVGASLTVLAITATLTPALTAVSAGLAALLASAT